MVLLPAVRRNYSLHQSQSDRNSDHPQRSAPYAYVRRTTLLGKSVRRSERGAERILTRQTGHSDLGYCRWQKTQHRLPEKRKNSRCVVKTELQTGRKTRILQTENNPGT